MERGGVLHKIALKYVWIACAITLFSVIPAPVSHFAIAQDVSSSANANEKLGHEIGNRITRVREFQFLREEAARLGVKAYLFGGTAAGFAHYVNWDLKRENGDTRFQPDRFDYDYTDIYRSTQDLDIVIDGPPEKAHALERKLAETYPHLQGSKATWEVRLLRQDMGEKQALLNNPDFLNQHTDSNSTGMIELTQPANGEPVVRDLRDWSSRDPFFLKDVREGKLHYYFSGKHGSTSFAKQGRNPPILSVIRYLTKAFQYELEIRPEDLAHIQKIIQEFDSKKGTQNSYVESWIEKNGKKLIQNAVNIEYAWDTLEKLGLRQKLAAIKGNASQVDSLAWWMNKEPLRSRKLGSKLISQGKLPSDLTVAHETSSFLAYESITRAHTGDPNVLISRAGMSGEAASYGNGFYTQIGRQGATGTGITIRFRVDPDAREGIDFTRSGNYLIFQNKNALKVIPESLKLTPVQYFEFLAHGNQVDVSERAIFEKLQRKITSQTLSDDEYRKIRVLIEESIEHGEFNEALLKEWARLPHSARFSKGLFDPLISREVFDIPLSELVFSQPSFDKDPEFHRINESARKLRTEFATLSKNPDQLRENLKNLVKDNKMKTLKLVPLMLSSPSSVEADSVLIEELLPQMDHEFFALKALERIPSKWSLANRPAFYKMMILDVLNRPQAQNWKHAREKLFEALDPISRVTLFTQEILSKPGFGDDKLAAKTLESEYFMRDKNQYRAFASSLLSQPHTQDWTRALLIDIGIDSDSPLHLDGKLISRLQDPQVFSELVADPTIPDRSWTNLFHRFQDFYKDPKWLEEFLKQPSLHPRIYNFILSEKPHPELLRNKSLFLLAISKAPNESLVGILLEHWFLNKSPYASLPWAIEALAKRFPTSERLVHSLSLRKDLLQHPEWLEPIFSSHEPRPASVDSLLAKILSDPAWKERTDWLQKLIGSNQLDPRFYRKLLKQPHWEEHPELRKMCGGSAPTLKCLRLGHPSPSLSSCISSSLPKLIGH